MLCRNGDLVSALVPPPRIVTRKIEVAAITGPVSLGTVIMLPKGAIVSGTMAHSDYNTPPASRGSGTQSRVRDLSNVGIRPRIYANYEPVRDGYVTWNINERCVLLHVIKPTNRGAHVTRRFSSQRND